MNNNNKNFFNSVSLFYDDMIGFDSSILRRIDFYKKLLNPAIKTAADLGCGTGLDSIALAKNGLKVTGFDLSPEMIKAAKKNAVKHNCKINFICSGIDKIPIKYYKKFDLAVSMGNTLANLNEVSLYKTIKKVYNILSKNGVFIIQVLNFQKIIKENNRIIKISSLPGEYVIRFYDILNRYLNFNILKFSTTDSAEHNLITTRLFVYMWKEINLMLKNAGFKNPVVYGSIALEKFNKKTSNDMVIIAEK